MRLPLDPHHYEAPWSVLLGVVAALTWAAGEALRLVAQIPSLLPVDPKVVKDMTDGEMWKYVSLCAILGVLWLGRWIVTTQMKCLNDNTAALKEMSRSIDAWSSKADSLVMPAVAHAMNETFDDRRVPAGLGNAKKRGGIPGRPEE